MEVASVGSAVMELRYLVPTKKFLLLSNSEAHQHQQYPYSQGALLLASSTIIMDTNQRSDRPKPDPHFERLHGPPLSYARSMQSFLQAHDPKPAPTNMGSPTETSGFSHPTVPNLVDFGKGKTPARDMPPPPTPAFPSGFQTPSESICSVVNCESGCNPSLTGSGTCSLSQCNNQDQCTSEECCRELACLDHSSAPTTRRASLNVSTEDQYASSSHDMIADSDRLFPAYANLPYFAQNDDDDLLHDPLHCHWLLPDQECDITAPTNDALSQHVLQDHIQPETSLMCGWADCDEQVNAPQLTDHMWNSHLPEQHAPDSYICLWDGCMEMFLDAEQLEKHMESAHTQMESIDCRWGGCSTITSNSTELQSHVNAEHLQLHIQPAVSSSDMQTDLSDGRSSKRRNHPLYWTQENDDLLVRVRAQNLTFPQIASQYFPDKSAQALRDRYSRVYCQESQSNLQPTEHPIPLSPDSTLPAAPSSVSPYESQRPSVDPPLVQATRAFFSHHSSQPAVDQPSRRCMWVIDDPTQALCGALFESSNELQSHVESSHYPLSEQRKRRPLSHWVCKWMGCVHNRETRGTRDKLRRHICTHTGCKSTPIIEDFAVAQPSQSIHSCVNIVVKNSVTAPNSLNMNALIRRRNPTSAMIVTWPLLAEMDCVSSRTLSKF